MKDFLRKCSYLYYMMIQALHRPFRKKSASGPVHKIYTQFLSLTAQSPSPAILEIGSRNVMGLTRRGLFPHCNDYTGFDVLAGEGVDIVGDAHKLSESCPAGQYDFVFSISVFEHLLSPWKVVLEINKVMKQGGYVFLSTHPVWPAHELPWDFWRFQENGFHALFNKFTGFEIIDLSEGLPAKLYSLTDDVPTRRSYLYSINQGVALIARKTGEYRSDLLQWDIEVAEIVDTMYPEKIEEKAGQTS